MNLFAWSAILPRIWLRSAYTLGNAGCPKARPRKRCCHTQQRPGILDTCVEVILMPVFDFGDWPNVITAMPGYGILATMCYPKKPLRRKELHAALVTECFLRYVEDSAPIPRPLSVGDLLPLLKARHDGRSYHGYHPRHLSHKITRGILLVMCWRTFDGSPHTAIRGAFSRAVMS